MIKGIITMPFLVGTFGGGRTILCVAQFCDFIWTSISRDIMVGFLQKETEKRKERETWIC